MSNSQQDLLVDEIKTSLSIAEKALSGRKKVNTSLLIIGMTSSAAATLVAGFTAAGGPLIGSGTEGWRLACIIAAIFGFAATVSNGLGQQLKVNEHLIVCTQCVNKLRSLNLGITTGSKSQEEISREYQEIVNNFPEFIS